MMEIPIASASPGSLDLYHMVSLHLVEIESLFCCRFGGLDRLTSFAIWSVAEFLSPRP